MLNNVYRESLLNHPYGYALYEPQLSSTVKPGVCGYVDPENGIFVPLIGKGRKVIDLNDSESLESNGLSVLNNVYAAEPEKKFWGPKTSSKVNGSKVNLSANASLVPAGIPAEVGALYEFESSSDFGAILLTKAPVFHNRIYGSTTFREWCRDNSSTLLKSWPEIKGAGLIIVTSTYSTVEANINAWSDKSKKVSIGFKASAVDVFEVAPSSEWYKAASDGGWIAAKAEKIGSLNEDQRVVFFGGLFFKYRVLAAKFSDQYALASKPLGALRSASDATSFSFAHENGQYAADSEEIGEGEVNMTPPPEEEADEEDEVEDEDF